MILKDELINFSAVGYLNEEDSFMNQEKLLSKPRAYIFFIVTGFLFLFCCRTGHKLAESGNILWTTEYTLSTLLISLIAGGGLGAVICFFLYRAASYEKSEELNESDSKAFIQWLWNRTTKTGQN